MMSMTKELAVQIAQKEVGTKKLSGVMEKANEIFKNNSTDWNIPFAEQDIVFAKFVDYMKESCTQKELDLVLVSDKLTRAWDTLHIDMKLMGKEPTEYQKKDISLTVDALKRLALLELLTKDLPKNLTKWIDSGLSSDLNKKTKKLR